LNDLFGQWFLQGGEAVVAPNRSILTRDGNRVTAYIEVRDYYQALAQAIAKSQGGRAHFVLISGWQFDPSTPINPSVNGQSTIGGVLESASTNGVQIQALIWAHPDGSNEAAVAWFSNLPAGAALHDDRVLFAASHHQKFAVVKNDDGLTAFCGGMDIASNRLADGAFKQPWHDVQVGIAGPGAFDIWQTFYMRWVDQVTGRYAAYTTPRPMLPQPASSGSTQSVQILRTFGNGGNHLGLNFNKVINRPKFLQPRRQGRIYQFAPNGERSLYRLLIKAVRASQTSIYIEDQYFIESEPIDGEASLGTEMGNALSRSTFQGMVILTNGVGTIQPELYQVNYRRDKLWTQITTTNWAVALDPNVSAKVSAWAYKAGEKSPFWMHSKTWIFDDMLAIVGSANCNRRGYSHDSEIAVAVLDGQAAENLPFAHDLRVRLWMKHLNSIKDRVKQGDLVNFADGMKYWVDGDETNLEKLKLSVPDPFQPDRLLSDPVKGVPKGGWNSLFHELEKEFTVLKGSGRDFEWDKIIDPDGS
jgi:phosphatidylserine/phosphatidylglycerophosphate/cardiolipin synthase-like enzyme